MKKYMTTKILTLAFCLIGTAFTTQAFENDLRAICKRPGKNELFIGGEFNTLMVVDAVSGQTLRQFQLNHYAIDLQFTNAGKHLLVYDGEKVHFLDAESGEETQSIAVSHVRFADGSPYIVDLSWIDSKITIYSAVDGSMIGSFEPGFELHDYGFNGDFSELIILGSSTEIENENSLITQKITKVEGYNVFNTAYVDQQEDNEGAYFAVYDLKTQSEKLKTVIPYHTTNSFDLNASKFGNNYYLACWDMLLKIDPTGKVTPIESEHASFTYASGSEPAGTYIFLADTKQGFIYNCANGNQSKFDGRDEFEFSYTCDFAFENSSAFMLSQDYSIIHMDCNGKILRKLKVEQTSSKGFGVYYTNGFYKKEARDKEAAIINKELEALGLPVVDLEAKVGDSNVLLGVFGTMAEAEAFKKAMNTNGLQYITKIAPIAED